jgi:hypothetical protein
MSITPDNTVDAVRPFMSHRPTPIFRATTWRSGCRGLRPTRSRREPPTPTRVTHPFGRATPSETKTADFSPAVW